MRSKLISTAPLVVWLVVIFYLSSLPDLPTNQIDLVDLAFKKSAHFLEYAILCFLFFRSFGYQKLDSSILFSLSYAFSDEIHQLFVPGRTGRLTDVLIDFLGISLVAWFIIRSNKWKHI